MGVPNFFVEAGHSAIYRSSGLFNGKTVQKMVRLEAGRETLQIYDILDMH